MSALVREENAFVDAAACGDLEDIKRLLAEDSTTAKQVNAIDRDGRSAFHYACLNDDLNLLKILMADERVDVGLRTPKGDSCVHLAALYACLEVLKILFQDDRTQKLINSQNQWGETPLHLCAGSGDKGASKAAKLLLDAGASVLEVDQWNRGPMDVANDNAENMLVQVFSEYLDSQSQSVRDEVARISQAHKKNQLSRPKIGDAEKKEHAKIFGQLGGALKALKKVSVTEKQMFSKTEGKVASHPSGHDAKSTGKILSKMVEFPGDKEEIKRLLADESVSAGGKDAFGLTALHKFASWNKVEFMDMLLPHLSKEDLNVQDPDGKTALHLACEMASVAAVQRLVAHPDVDPDIKDAKGRTAMDIVESGSGSIVARLKKALKKE